MAKSAPDDVATPSRRSREAELRAILLSIPAVAIPVAGAFLFPVSLQDYEALLWLLALIPAFLLAYYRGWRGAATALALGMALLSVTYAATQALGRPVPGLLWGVLTFYIGITLGIGWLAERVARRKFEEAEVALALRDPLTELPNRRYAERALELEFAAAERGRPLAVVIFDFDHFSRFNDINGRPAGDGVLRGFGALLRQSSRRMNVAARYGPEEFVCILGGCGEDGAVIFASRIQDRLRAAESSVPLPTVSAGIAIYRPGVDTPQQLLIAAEDALLAAKEAGRDRVRVFGHAIASDQRVSTIPPSHEEAVLEPDELRITFPATAEEPLGTSRSACVILSDAAVRSRLARWLEKEQFKVQQALSVTEAVQASQGEHDVLFVELQDEAAGLPHIIEEVRARDMAVRIVGVPKVHGASLPQELLAIRVDGHLLPSQEPSSFRVQLAELLRESDRLRATQVRQSQLTAEVRAVEREGRMALAASEARYRSVIQSIQQVVFATDGDGRLTFLNSAWTAITGHALEDSVGRYVWEFLHPDDAEDVRVSFTRLVQRADTFYLHEGRWRTRSEAYRWMESRFQVSIGADGDYDGVTGVVTDVTDRRQAEDALRRSEEYYRSLIENSIDMMAVINADGSVRYVSPAVARVLGYTSEAWNAPDATRIVHPDDARKSRGAFAAVMEAPGASRTVELRLRHADGHWRTVEVTMRNQLDTAGMEGIVINARDITDRRLTESALRESEEMLARAQRMEAIGRLAGGVAHDFNNLLTAIQGHAALLLEQTQSGSDIHDDVKEIRDAAARATSLTRQLLAFSRRQVLQPRVIHINSIVQDMDSMLRRMIGENIILQSELAEDLGVVRADPAQVEQIILNLVMNSRDALPRGGHVTIRTANRTIEADDAAASELQPGPYVVLEVEDDGEGMTQDVTEHAFEPFFTTKSQGKGTGLGLATVYGAAKQSGGHVWLMSKPGDGTVVTLCLPRVPASERVVTESAAAPDVTQLGGSETILLVEDQAAVRDLAERILTRQGYTVLTAVNGRDALERLEERGQGVDLVVSDVVMPEMDGCDLSDELAVRYPGARVILMSGYAEDVVVRQGNMGEGRAFIAKPFSPTELHLKVRSVLNAGDASEV